MPARSRFVDAPHYYSTLFHELVHSTGHESRLNRTFGARFGDELYSKEELVAEMGAAFLCAIAGIANEHTDRNTTAYIQNWISKLEEDNRLIVHAAANAQKAVDLILGTDVRGGNYRGNRGGCRYGLLFRRVASSLILTTAPENTLTSIGLIRKQRIFSCRPDQFLLPGWLSGMALEGG